jgi:hypothetical protein
MHFPLEDCGSHVYHLRLVDRFSWFMTFPANRYSDQPLGGEALRFSSVPQSSDFGHCYKYSLCYIRFKTLSVTSFVQVTNCVIKGYV